MANVNHYKYCEKHLATFLSSLGINIDYSGLIGAHGDKCYSYRSEWEESGIPFPHGVAIYLLSGIRPYSKEVRQTENGWVAPDDWVLENYEGGHGFKNHLPPVDETDTDILNRF